jgi:hypothetical protein
MDCTQPNVFVWYCPHHLTNASHLDAFRSIVLHLAQVGDRGLVESNIEIAVPDKVLIGHRYQSQVKLYTTVLYITDIGQDPVGQVGTRRNRDDRKAGLWFF